MMRMRKFLQPLTPFALGLIASIAQAQTWHSYDTVIRTTGGGTDGLERGEIAAVGFGSEFIAPLAFYHSNTPFGVDTVRTGTLRNIVGGDPTGLSGLYFPIVLPTANPGNGLTRPIVVGGSPAHGGITGPWWALPGGQSGDNQLYVGKSGIARGSDLNETGVLPGNVSGVFDLETHSAVGADTLSVIAFVAPVDGDYLLSDLAIRRVVNYNGGSQLGKQSLKVFDSDMNEVLDSLTIADFATTGNSWVLNPNEFLFENLTAGDRIYFGVHHNAFDTVGDWSYDNTEIAFTMSLVPVPEPRMLATWLGLGSIVAVFAYAARRKTAARNGAHHG